MRHHFSVDIPVSRVLAGRPPFGGEGGRPARVQSESNSTSADRDGTDRHRFSVPVRFNRLKDNTLPFPVRPTREGCGVSAVTVSAWVAGGAVRGSRHRFSIPGRAKLLRDKNRA